MNSQFHSPLLALQALVVSLVTLAFMPAMAVTVSTDRALYDPGQSISVSFSGGPGNARDWIGIYPAGVSPGDQDSVRWLYVDGTVEGLTGSTEGTVTFAGGLGVAGSWTVYLLEDDSYTALAEAGFQVQAVPTSSRVYSRHSAYYLQEPIEISWAQGPGNSLDWIGIYPEGTVPGSVPSTLWLYVDGTQESSVGLSEGRVTFESGLNQAGVYDAHLLDNDGYLVLASTQFSVLEPSDPIVRSDRRFYAPGDPIQIQFEVSYWVKDWVGIYPAHVTPGEQEALLWLYVDGSRNGNQLVFEGTLNFPQGLSVPGDYHAYLLEDDGYVVLARERFTVQADVLPPPVLSIERTGQNIILSWPVEAGSVTLEQTATLIPPSWTATPGVSGSSITLPAGGSAMFYRLSR
jgi:acid phosphatase type 7